MPRKFKLGDRVEVIANKYPGGSDQIGHEGVIAEYDQEGGYQVKLDGRDCTLFFLTPELRRIVETELGRLAKQLMLRDLRRILTDWEEGKYTWADISQVALEIVNTINHWPDYELKATKMLEPQQLPLIPNWEEESDHEI